MNRLILMNFAAGYMTLALSDRNNAYERFS